MGVVQGGHFSRHNVPVNVVLGVPTYILFLGVASGEKGKKKKT